MTLLNLNHIYLHLAFWMWLTAVFTFNDPPMTCCGHVVLKIFSLHSDVALFVWTADNFARASCQVILPHNINQQHA